MAILELHISDENVKRNITFYIHEKLGQQVLSQPLNSTFNQIDFTALKVNQTYFWYVQTKEGETLHKGNFYLLPTSEAGSRIEKLFKNVTSLNMSNTEKLSLAMALFDQGFEFNAQQMILSK